LTGHGVPLPFATKGSTARCARAAISNRSISANFGPLLTPLDKHPEDPKEAAKADRDGRKFYGRFGWHISGVRPGQRHAAAKPGWIACQDDFMPTDFLAKRNGRSSGAGLKAAEGHPCVASLAAMEHQRS
jgi:hypothetical protein